MNDLVHFLSIPGVGGGAAGAVAWAIVRIVEAKTGITSLKQELAMVKAMHEACHQKTLDLEARIVSLYKQFIHGCEKCEGGKCVCPE